MTLINRDWIGMASIIGGSLIAVLNLYFFAGDTLVPNEWRKGGWAIVGTFYHLSIHIIPTYLLFLGTEIMFAKLVEPTKTTVSRMVLAAILGFITLVGICSITPEVAKWINELHGSGVNPSFTTVWIWVTGTMIWYLILKFHSMKKLEREKAGLG